MDDALIGASDLPPETKLAADLEPNVRALRSALGDTADLVVTRRTSCDKRLAFALCYLNGIIDARAIEEAVLRPLARRTPPGGRDVTLAIEESVVDVASSKRAATMGEVVEGLLKAQGVLFIEGAAAALVLELREWPQRQVDDPKDEAAVRGPGESFIELLITNVALVRRHVRNRYLRVRTMEVGGETKTTVALLYLDNLADPDLVAEVRRRIEGVGDRNILDSAHLAGLIKDSPWSPFPLLWNTERVDRATGYLLEGRVVILTDGSPGAIIAPTTFFDLFAAPEDYYFSFYYGTILRFIRLINALLAMTLPPLYISLVSYNVEMLPTKLALLIAGTRQGIPIPALIEVVLIELAMEALREASVRMPRAMGQTIGVVGALILGTAAVQAGIISNMMVIVVAVTAITSFAMPSYQLGVTTRVLKYFLVAWAAVFGTYGLVLGFSIILAHQIGLESFGVPYFSPAAPGTAKQAGSTLLRFPLFLLPHEPGYVDPLARRHGRLRKQERDYE